MVIFVIEVFQGFQSTATTHKMGTGPHKNTPWLQAGMLENKQTLEE